MKEHRSLTRHEKRTARKAQRLKSQSLVAPADGSQLGDNASHRIDRCQAGHRATDTVAQAAFERIARGVCDSHAIKLSRQQVVVISEEVFFVLDFWLPEARVAVEVDGREHGRPTARQKDEWRDKLLLDSKGIRTLRVSNTDATTQPAAAAASLVAFLAAHGNRSVRRRLAAR